MSATRRRKLSASVPLARRVPTRWATTGWSTILTSGTRHVVQAQLAEGHRLALRRDAHLPELLGPALVQRDGLHLDPALGHGPDEVGEVGHPHRLLAAG